MNPLNNPNSNTHPPLLLVWMEDNSPLLLFLFSVKGAEVCAGHTKVGTHS